MAFWGKKFLRIGKLRCSGARYGSEWLAVEKRVEFSLVLWFRSISWMFEIGSNVSMGYIKIENTWFIYIAFFVR